MSSKTRNMVRKEERRTARLARQLAEARAVARQCAHGDRGALLNARELIGKWDQQEDGRRH